VLQAITRRKGESFLKGNSTKAPREDIMTDAVFGGLRYFDPGLSGLALNWLLPDIVSAGSLVREVRLWAMRNRVEPDVLIDLQTQAGQPYRVIIEAKWLGNPITAAQLDDQWREFGPDSAGCEGNAHHVLLVQRRIRVEPTAYQDAPPELRQWRHLITWRDLAAAADRRKSTEGTPQLHLWMSDVVRVINLGEGKAFVGWSTTPPVEPPQSFFQSAFWLAPSLSLPVVSTYSFFR